MHCSQCLHFLFKASILTTIGAIGLMIWLACTHHSKSTEAKRFGIFVGFTFLMGEFLSFNLPECRDNDLVQDVLKKSYFASSSGDLLL